MLNLRSGILCSGFLTFLVLVVRVCLVSAAKKDYETLLNTCLDTNNSKSIPGPEADLYKQCKQWAKHSCCTESTSVNVHEFSLYNFKLNHCPAEQKKLSDECQMHFVQDTCFYECDPNVGPWRVTGNRKFAAERFKKVPLCASECQDWFDACSSDFTCVVNWVKGMNFSGGQGNRCPDTAPCRTFKEIYSNNASLFCNQVWDESFVVVPDSQLCMRLFFDAEEGNPNERVAREYVKELMRKDQAGITEPKTDDVTTPHPIQTTTPGSADSAIANTLLLVLTVIWKAVFTF